MAAIYVCLFFVSLQIITAWNHTVITGLYCQDPDTGNLHAVNTTWRSKSFCGNYTCKLRLKNFTETEYVPIKVINITLDSPIFVNTESYSIDGKTDQTTEKNSYKTENIKQNVTLNTNTIDSLINNDNDITTSINTREPDNLDTHKNIIDMLTSPSTQINRQTAPEENNIYISTIKPDTENKQTNTNTTAMSTESAKSDDDRYLSESEIKQIAESLRSVRKSDLEAIIDIYNIAQEIYKEVDDIGTTTEKMLEKSTSPLNNLPYARKKHINCNKDNKSYWYDPYNLHKEAKIASSIVTPTYYYPKPYLRRTLGENALQKVPYYYPISDFQRLASYVKPSDKMDKFEIQAKAPSFISNPWSSTVKNPVMDSQTKTPILLPYPFSYIRHYNISSHPDDFNYNNYPWEKLDVYNKNRNYIPFLNLFNTEKPNLATVSNTELAKLNNPQFNVKDPISLKNTVDLSQQKILPEWHEVPNHLLEEAKGNVMNKTKLLNMFPRKNVKDVKVELVGKVLKLDELVRKKRFDAYFNDSETDTVLEKVTCESSTEIGFFRHGNESEPYPACCPQRIES